MKTTYIWCFFFTALVLSESAFAKLISGSATSLPKKRSVQPPFFAGGIPPTGLPGTTQDMALHQQTLPDDPPNTPPYFVSLFDPSTNTPFYSAYKVTPIQAGNLGNEKRPGGIKFKDPPGVPGVSIAYKEAIADTTQPGKPNQALTRGHLNPSAINSLDKRFMTATYTFTNAVPQFAATNFYLTNFESRVENYAKNNCGRKDGTLYLLSGTSENGLIINQEGKPVQDLSNQIPKPYQRDTFVQGTIKLVTPRSTWTAGCCIWLKPGEARRAESFAVMSNNQNKRTKVLLTEMRVLDLEELLKTPPSAAVNLFPGEEECRRPENNIPL
ncbi:uncharacterized protein LOC111344015 [Stylophora pistillata]|uniref:DNA/RNA non-specific endonuclease/pyrophosphatase/phosphodiesterase domain-containing protein n=1 Tax=Stylophora pistillata TaxID=50429 RepID=A0A2B4RE07_STYPI|nr:uncharacterized protein LOC111344015 [Stylophora pistillata]XP_022806952.1 uncharacterized protein LOC111344015 [Stylophora pistillata]XP_022806953.1 uncharacterized protein LOC111344015 [Stylophora pistillata]PFX15063.1 hypothetical protein AWC38_SpisGene20738 [Stylophora pistillata]